MSFGFPLRNGAPVGLASIAGFGKRVAAFSPASLFTGGVQGAWYDPSDYTTLFQDAAGTTPVTAVEQPVRLMLDKSQGLVLGSELVTNGDFATDTNWTKGSGWTISGGTANLSGTAGTFPTISQNFTYTIGVWYQVTFTVSNRTAGTVQFTSRAGGQRGPAVSANGTYSFYFAAIAGDNYFGIQDQNSGAILSIDNISVKALPGNHATAPNDASRPVLRARYNLLTYSEQFDNAAWTKTNATVTANATTAPDGTSTADFLVETAATGSHQIVSNVNTISGVTYVSSFYAKANGRDWVAFYTSSASGGAGRFAYFDLVNGAVGTVQSPLTASIQSVGNGWYRCSVTFTTNSAGELSAIIIASANGVVSYAGDITKGVFIWGAQAVPTAVFPSNTYQRIAAATDYATTGFLPYLAFDGSDDSMSTASINFTGGDAMSVFAGVTKLSDAAQGVIAELSATIASNNGTFLLTAPNSAAANYNFSSKGTAQADATTGSVYAAPTTDVLTGQADISSDTLTLRIDGVPAASSTVDQGTGNYGNYPLYVGRRNNASLPFNGRLYSLIVAAKTVSASELASTEAYVAAKTGVTLLAPTFDFYTTQAGDFIILDNGDNVVSPTYYA